MNPANPMDIFTLKATPISWDDVIVTNASTPGVNGRYVYAGYLAGRPYWINTNTERAGTGLVWTGSNYVLCTIEDLGIALVFYNFDAFATFPYGNTWTAGPNAEGDQLPKTFYPNQEYSSNQARAFRLLLRPVYYNLQTLIRDTYQFELGEADGVLIGAVPDDTPTGSTLTGFYYINYLTTGEGSTPQSSPGLYHGSATGTGQYAPLLIRGAQALRSLMIAGTDPNTETTVSIQLLTGNV